jgi:uncharacterized protein
LLKGRLAVTGEVNFKALLSDMRPEMREGVFVFCTIAKDEDIPAALVLR